MTSRQRALRTTRRQISLATLWAVLSLCLTGIASAESPAPVSVAEARGLASVRPATAPGQQATLLPDGRWLLTGGEIEGGPSNQIEVVANSQATALVAVLSNPRSGHTATVLPDGTVFVFGGTGPDGRLVHGAEVIDPVHGTVTEQAAAGLTPRTLHSATLLTNGQLLIAGGQDASGRALSSVQLWDPRKQSAPVESNLLVARFAHEAALLASGEGLVWGGQGADRKPTGNGEIYDPTTNLIEGSVDATDSRIANLVAARNQPPLVADTLPQIDALDVPLDTVLAVRFSKPLPISKLDSKALVLVGPTGTVEGSVVGAEGGMLAFFTPFMELRPATIYTLFITGLVDEEGRELPSTAIRFTTHRIVAPPAAPASSAPPVVINTIPEPAPKMTIGSTASPAPTAQKPAIPLTATVPPPPKEPITSAAIEEDWTPSAQNRHGSWRVLGLAGDPPLQTAGRGMAALSAAANQTALAGQVFRLNGMPLPGVSVSVGALRTTTDAWGRFLLSGVQPGAVEFKVDGTGVVNGGRHYTAHYLFTTVRQGTTNVLPFPIYLVRVDPASEVSISSPADHDIILTHPLIPGLQVKIPQGAVIRDPEGRIVTKVSLTPVPIDRPPFPVPAPFTVYFTLQPAGAWIDGDPSKAVRVTYPNYQGAAAGTVVDFWNDDPSAKGWHVYGHGRVSSDQTQIVADASVGFRELMHFSWATAPQAKGGTAPATAPIHPGCPVADPVDCGTGLFIHNVTDLTVNDVIPITLTRMYRTNDNVVHAFGVGNDLSYNMRLFSPTSSVFENDIVLADGSRVQYFLEGSGCSGRNDCYLNTNSPTVFNGSVMWADSDTVFLKDGTVLQFATSAPYQLSSIKDRYGNVVTITTSVVNAEVATAPPVTQVTSPNGRYIQFFYDSYNRITSAVDNAGRTTSYAYDTQSHLISATDADGNTEHYSYDPTTNNMSVVTDKRGNTATQNTYDGNGRVSQQQLADGAIWQFSYVLSSAGNVIQTTVTDPRGYVRQHTFNAYGYPTQTILAVGQPEQQTYAITYNPSNLPLQVTDTLSRQTVYGYDSDGDLTSVTALAGTANAVTYQMTYDPTYHQLSSMTDPLGHTKSITIGAAGNPVSVTDALGNASSLAFNSQGLITSASDPLGHTIQIAYGAAGNVSSVTDPLSRTTQLAEDDLGRRIGATDPLGNNTQLVFDGMDRTTGITNTIGGNTTLSYDQNGNLLAVTDPRNVVQTYSYDARNRLQTYKDPAGKTATYNYDGMSNITSVVDRKNQTTRVTYDGIERPTLITYDDGTTVAISWDAGNRPTRFVDSLDGTISRTYDGFDRLTQETSSQGTVNYTYDAAGRRQTMTATGQAVVNYTFDSDNRLTQVAQGTATLGFGYDASSRRTSVILPNGIVGTYTFDNGNQLTGITYANGSTQIGALTYGYDLAGRRASVGGSLAGFVPPNYVASMTYDGTNRLTSWNGTPLNYDADGNLTGYGAATYTWNARNQLTGTSAGAGTFAYDALGRRVSATVNGVATTYLYDGVNPAVTGGNLMMASGNLDEILAQVGSTTTTSYLRDGTNSTAALTSSNGTLSTTLTYSPYGDSAQGGSVATAFQYTGRENDGATGLYYYRARYYSPQLGRFVSEDPVGLRGGANFYAYAGGNPVNFSDPLGLFQIVVGVGGTVIAPGAAVGGSFNIGFNIDGWNSSAYIQDQGNIGWGGGAYLGGGFNFQYSPAGPPTTGFDVQDYAEVDVGPLGTSFTRNSCGRVDPAAQVPLPRVHIKARFPGGAGAFVGSTGTATAVSPTLGQVSDWLNQQIISALSYVDSVIFKY